MEGLRSIKPYSRIYHSRSRLRLTLIGILTVNFVLYLYCFVVLTPPQNTLNESDAPTDQLQISEFTRIQQGVARWVPHFDSHDYAYIHNPADKCQNSNGSDADLLLVMFVNSAPSHRSKRDFVRQTIGNENAWPKVRGRSTVRIVFMLGAVDDDALQSAVDEESAIFQDIVQETFMDSYINLTLKSLMGFKWVTLHCRQAKFVLKLDDDVVLNIPMIYNLLQNFPETGLAFGRVLITGPIWNIFSKYYTPWSVYPHFSYPPYFRGIAYILSTDVAESVYRTSMTLPMFPWSDVFVGMCLEKIGIKLKNMEMFDANTFRTSNGRIATDKNAIAVIRKYACAWHFKREHQLQLWNIWQNS